MPIAHSIEGDRALVPGAHPRIAIAAEPRYFEQAQPACLAAALEKSGEHPIFLDPREADASSLLGLDLLVVRGRSPALLDLLELAESLGIATINRRAAVAAVLDKGSMARALASAGLPTPPTRIGTKDQIAWSSRPSDFPLVVKPVFGDNARGVRVVETARELDELPWTEPIMLAQPLVPSDGFDLKVYVAGSEVHAVLKPSPIDRRSSGAARPVPATPALRALALRCGLLFGLDLFGVDCIATPAGPVVIEVNDFPNYSGVDGAADRLARFALTRVERVAASGGGE